MNLLVTAGNTQTPIDRVRCITNIFTGRTGAGIALEAHRRGHAVLLLTSHPEVVDDLKQPGQHLAGDRWNIRPYRTFDDLQRSMTELISPGQFDVLVHSAAVSDYQPAGIYAPAEPTHFHEVDGSWDSTHGPPRLIDVAAGKVKSNAPELWLRLLRTPKLVDLVRSEWGFQGVLVKFKLEVGVSDDQLLEIAERSRRQSGADLMVANTLEGAADWAFIGPGEGGYERIERRQLADRLMDAVEEVHRERNHA